jgi:hypothetical protein
MTIAGLTFTVTQAASSGGSVPSAPTNLLLTSATATTIKIKWSHDGINVWGFKIERKTGSTGTWSQIGTGNSTSRAFSDNTVMGGKTYFYRVRAHNGSGDSPYSNELQVNTP